MDGENEDAVKEQLDRLTKDPMVDPIDDSLSDQELRNLVFHLKDHWTTPLIAEGIPRQAAQRFALADQQDANTLLPTGTNSLETALWKIEFAVTRIQVQLERRGMLDSSVKTGSTVVDPGMDIAADILKIRECILRLQKVLESELWARKACDPTWASEMPAYRNPFGVSMYESQKLTDQQAFVVYLLKNLANKGQQRYRDMCYEEILSPEQPDGKRQRTHAWREVCTIKEFVLRSAPKETSFDMWRNMQQSNNLEKATNYLEMSCEAEFQDLKPDRHWHAFHNGIQNTNEGEFMLWGSPDIPHDIVAVNYHELNFDTSIMDPDKYMDWYNVPTPKFHSILEQQMGNFPSIVREEIIRSIQMLLGRFLFEVNEKDSWQVIPFFCGRAGTGKSKVLDIVTSLFRKEDIEAVANNAQKGFGLETVYNKLGWKVMELKKDFSIDQAQLQSMITGEEVSIMRKNKTALTVVWKGPGLLAGNEAAMWSDNSGSISRRIIVIRFDRKVESNISDPNLGNAMKAEKGNLLHKLTCAQLSGIECMGKSDIWGSYRNIEGKLVKCLPEQFHEQKRMLSSTTQPIANFLDSENVKILPEGMRMLGMPFKVFVEKANEHINVKGFQKIVWNRDKYASIFEDYGITLTALDEAMIKRNGGPMDYLGKIYNVGEPWLLGITLSEVYRQLVL